MTASLLESPRARRQISPPDQRSIISAFDLYAAPAEVGGSVQIIRPFAVLSKNTYSAPVTLPIGPAYLAAVLAKAGYRVNIIDAVGEAIQQITLTSCGQFNIQGLSTAQVVDRLNPDARVIGVSMMFSQEWVEHRALIKALRAAKPNAIIVAGGEHATAMAEYILRDCPEIDYVVRGEGELAFLELCHAVFSSKDACGVGGICHINEAGYFIDSGLSRRIAAIDELPLPAWELCPVPNYFIDNWTMGIAMGRNMPIVATRGCPYQCTFCSNPAMWTTRYLMRDPKAVVDEIEFLIAHYAANSIDFFDLTAIVKREWILAFCAELRSRKINITWQLPSGTRSEALDGETLRAIYDAGCRFLVYAPESGSEATLREIKKKVHLSRLFESIRAAVAIGHTVKINLIIGFPHERLRHVVQSLLFACKVALIGAEDCNISIFSPYPGSELYYQLRNGGVIGDLNDDYFRSLIAQFDFTTFTSYAPRLPGWQLFVARVVGQGLFYVLSYTLHPRRIARLLGGLCSSGRFQAANLFEQRISDFFARRRIIKLKSSGNLAPPIKVE